MQAESGWLCQWGHVLSTEDINVYFNLFCKFSKLFITH